MTRGLSELRRSLRRELRYYRLVLAHERTPRLARILIGAAIAYAITPIDLIPDWIPVIGHFDDLLMVAVLAWLGIRLVPTEVVCECRELADAV